MVITVYNVASNELTSRKNGFKLDVQIDAIERSETL